MPVSSTTPGPSGARAGAPVGFAFHCGDSVGTRDKFSIAAQWLACTFPYRRFADTLADDCARLGADVARYTFIAVDLHHLLLAGLPAHLRKNSIRPAFVIGAEAQQRLARASASPKRSPPGATRSVLISLARRERIPLSQLARVMAPSVDPVRQPSVTRTRAKHGR